MLVTGEGEHIIELPPAVAPELTVHHLSDLLIVKLRRRAQVLAVIGDDIEIVACDLNFLVQLVDVRLDFSDTYMNIFAETTFSITGEGTEISAKKHHH